jgi:predicted HD superfamily hydrolase involved in NAD metabolism
MKSHSFDELAEKVKKVQSPARYQHSLSVAELAGVLGKHHGWNVDRARLAGLLHDWAKEWTPQNLARYVENNGIKIPNLKFIQKVSPNLLHAYVGSHEVRERNWITNPRDIHAIASHSLGDMKMGVEDKILFVADLASPDRIFPEAKDVRELAKIDLKKGFIEALRIKIQYQLKKYKAIHPLPVRVWNKYACGLNNE